MHLTANNASSAATNSTSNNSSNTTSNNGTASNNSSTNNTSGNNTTTNSNQPLTPEQILQETYTKMTSDILAERTLGDFLSEHPGELIRTGSPLFVCTVLPNHWRSVGRATANFPTAFNSIFFHLFHSEQNSSGGVQSGGVG